MRFLSLLAVFTLLASPVLALAPPLEEKTPLFDTSGFRPQIVFQELSLLSTKSYVTVRGIVFSRSPVDSVRVGNRTARLRPAEMSDLMRLDQVPRDARDAPYRVFFELSDLGLEKIGANDIVVQAMGTDERLSNRHLLTVVHAPDLARPAGSGTEGRSQP